MLLRKAEFSASGTYDDARSAIFYYRYKKEVSCTHCTKILCTMTTPDLIFYDKKSIDS